MSEKVEVDFGGWISKGITIWKGNVLNLVLAWLLVVVIGSLSFGILLFPLFAGFIAMTLALHDKSQPVPQVGDVFKGFSNFLPAFLLFLVYAAAFFVIGLIGCIPCLGWMLAPPLAVAVGTLAMYSIYLLVDKNLAVIESVRESIAIVRSNLFPFVGFYIVVSAIGGAGAIVCGVGSLVTVPLAVCITTVSYRACTASRSGSAEPVSPPLSPQA